MVSHSNFKLAFIQNNTEIPFAFYEDVESMYEHGDVSVVRENITLQVLFTSVDTNARLYMDGLELLPEYDVEDLDDSSNPYLRPRTVPYTIFEAYDKNDQYYPLIPGFYQIMVVESTRKFYAMYKIEPKQISEEQWDLMKTELEAELRGLAQDLVRKHLTIGSAGVLSNIPSKYIYQFLVMVKNFNGLINSLSDIIQKPIYRIKNQYVKVTEEKAKLVNPTSLRLQELISLQPGFTISPRRVYNYDLSENRFLIHMVAYMSRVLTDIEYSLDISSQSVKLELVDMERFQKNGETAAYKERKRVLTDLQYYIDIANKMSLSLTLVLKAPWTEEVSTMHGGMVHGVKYDSRYRLIHKVYRSLNNEQTEITIDSTYSYQWKRTDWLYEMWGFVNICKFLRNNLGYEAVSGWIFDSDPESRMIFVPMLKPNTTISFFSGDVLIKAIYNAEIPYSSKQTSMDNPLYVLNTRHNKPDLRLDIYVRDIYCGSLIIDFKYRPKKWIWTAQGNNSQNTVVTNQLVAYFTGPTSNYILSDKLSETMRKNIRPVREVWACYPVRPSQKQTNELLENGVVRLITLSPGEPTDHVIDALKKTISEIIEFGGEM